MIVKQINSIIKDTASQLELPEQLVEVIVRYYFWWIKDSLDNISFPSIHIPNIGTLYMAKANYLYALTNFLSLIRRDLPNKSYFVRKFEALWQGRHKMHLYYKSKKKRSPINGKNPEYYRPWDSGVERNLD